MVSSGEAGDLSGSLSAPMLEECHTPDDPGTPMRLARHKSPVHTWNHPTACTDANGVGELEGFSLTPPHAPAKLGVAAVVAMAFFNVSGGPWGSEDIFSSSCPMVGCLGILTFTVFFCMPQVLVTSELSCALPSNGGYLIWIREAFGDFWGFQVTYWQFVSGVADAAVYPVLICDTVMQVMGITEMGLLQKWLWRLLTTILLSLPTFVSISSVPHMLVAMAITTGAPVVTFIALGLPRVDTSVWTQVQPGKAMQLGKMINVLFWNLEGWDCVSTCSALCEEPIERTVPRGLFIALAITSTQYLFVLLVAAGISKDTNPWQKWDDGTLPSIGASLGVVMTGLLLISSLVGNAGQYMSEFLEDSYLLQGAAEIGVVPRFLGKVWSSGAPYMANVAQLCIILVMLSFDFSDILVFDNFFCASAISLEFAAFFWLRWSQPDMRRPFRVPSWSFVLFPPAAVVLLVVVIHCLTKSWKAFAINATAFVLGLPYGWWISRKSQQQHEHGHRSSLDVLLEDD